MVNYRTRVIVLEYLEVDDESHLNAEDQAHDALYGGFVQEIRRAIQSTIRRINQH